MNKRKILTLALAICMIAILAVGGSLAYLTDTDAEINVFTTGNVAIDLWEDFGDNDDTTLEKLLPTTGVDENGAQINGVEKEVYVKNTGSEDAFIRVHIAIPDLLDSGAKDDPALAAYNNIVHFNMSKASIAAGKWSWLPEYTTDVGYNGNGAGNWNTYETEITVNGKTIAYNVYVATYRTALKTNEATCDAIYQVYMDAATTNEQITTLKEKLGDQWNIYVVAEGAQAAGFEDAYTALNTAFGVPGSYEIDWNAIASEGDTLKETTAISERYPAATEAPAVQG